MALGLGAGMRYIWVEYFLQFISVYYHESFSAECFYELFIFYRDHATSVCREVSDLVADEETDALSGELRGEHNVSYGIFLRCMYLCFYV